MKILLTIGFFSLAYLIHKEAKHTRSIVMKSAADLKKDVAELNDATNELAGVVDSVGAVLSDLRGRVKAGMTQDEVDALGEGLDKATETTQALSARLRGLAADPAAVVPQSDPIPDPAASVDPEA